MRSFKLNFLPPRRNRFIAQLSGFFVLLLCCCSTTTMQAQVMQQTATLTACTDFQDGDTYTDSGGAAANYATNELSTLTLVAQPGETVTVTFTAFDVEASTISACFDNLTVSGATAGNATYSGDANDAGAGLVCTDATDGAGNPTLGPFTSAAGGSLTFLFDSDSSVNQSGWTATISLSAACPVIAPPPANDLCAAAVALNPDGTTASGTTVGATSMGAVICSGVDVGTDGGVWYTVAIPAGPDGDVQVDLSNLGAGVVADLAVYTGACGALTCVGGNSDVPTPSFNFPATAGTTYTIYVEDFDGFSTSGTFDIGATFTPDPPVNDLCGNGTVLTCTSTGVAGTMVGSTNTDGPATCGFGKPGVWYTFAGTGDIVTITLNQISNIDAQIYLGSGTCAVPAQLSCTDNNFTDVGVETFTFTSAVGTDYYIYVRDFFSRTTGSFTIDVSCCPPITVNPVVATDESCDGVGDGTLTATATGGAGATLEYSIDGFATTNTTGVFTGLADGPYTVQVRYAGDNPCALTATAPAPTVVAQGLVNCGGFSITDPCTCNNDANPIDLDAGTGGDMGTFGEVVSIPAPGALLPPGLFFTVAANDLLFTATTGTDLGAPVGTPLTFVPDPVLGPGLGTYAVPFNHVDQIGYTMVVEGPFLPGSPFNIHLTISNKCAYPNPAFVGFPAADLCATAAPIALAAVDTDGAAADAGSPTFSIGGAAVTTIDPAALGAGTYQVNLSFDAADDGNGGVSPDGGITPARPGCIQTAFQSVTIVQAPTITAIMPTDESCDGANDGMITVTADGNPPGGGTFQYALFDPVTNAQLFFSATGVFTNLPDGNYLVGVQNTFPPAPPGCTVFAAAATTIAQGANCGVTITDPCSCNNDATIIDVDAGTGGADGTFSETVTIGAPGVILPAGLTFTVVAANPNPGGGVTMGTNMGAPVGTAAVYNAGAGTYDITFNHVDAIGYNIVIEGPQAVGNAGNLFFEIGNNCSYPNPLLVAPGLPLGAVICANATAIPLNALDLIFPPANGNGFDVLAFTVSSATLPPTFVTEIDPSVLGPGVYALRTLFDGDADGNGGIAPPGGTAQPGCFQDVTQQFTIVAAPTVQQPIALTNESCFGASDGTITVTATGTGGTFEYSIDGGATFQASNVFMNVAPGAYNVVVQNTTPPAPPTCASPAVPVTIAAGPVCDLNLADPCNCNEDATTFDFDTGLGGLDGTFNETVTVSGPGGGMLPAGLTFTLAAANPNPGGGVTAGVDIPVGTVAVFDPVTGTYSFMFNHVDGVGYNIVVEGPAAAGTPGNLFNEIGNNCSYPFPVFAPPLPAGPICANADPIALLAFDAAGGPIFGGGFDFLGFDISGPGIGAFTPINEIDPSAYGPGVYTITITFDGDEDGNGGVAPPGGTAFPGCTSTAVQQITIIQAPTLELPFTIVNESCAGANDGSITATASGGAAGAFDYSIDGFATFNQTGVFTGLAPGNYVMQVSNPAVPFCVDSQPFTIAAGVVCATVTDPCVCLDNSSTINLPAGTGGTDGGFGELVSITGPGGAALPAGLVFTVGAPTNGVFDAFNVPVMGTPQNNVAIATNNTVALTYNVVNGHYELPFVHIDGQGYNLTIDGPGGLVFNSTNACAYPNPVFNPALPLVDICPNAAPLALGGSAPAPAPAPGGTATFTINGAPAVNINPAALGIGTHTVVMTFDGAADGLGGVGGTVAAPAMPGCIQTVTQQITIDDTVNPVAVCAAGVFVDLDANGMGSTTAAAVNGASTDNCGIATVTAGPLDFDCDDIGANIVTLTVTDINGNVDTEACTVTVRDLIPATILCRAPVNTVNDLGECGADVILLPPLVITENCSIATITNDVVIVPAGPDFQIGTTTVTWTLTDAGGNATTCTQNVTVHDTEAPVIDCPTSFVAYTSWDNCGYPAGLLGTPTATDNCPGVTIAPDSLTMTQTFYGPGQYMATYIATDASGNEATCMQWVTIHDATVPQLTSCPADTITAPATTATGGNVSWTLPTAIDNCPTTNAPVTIIVEANGYAPGDFFPLGDTEISYNLYDPNGQFVQCEFLIQVVASAPLNLAMTCMDDLDISLQNAMGWAAFGWNPPLMETNCEECETLASDDFDAIGTLKGHQYYTHTATPMTFAEAIAYAENVGAAIAVLEDKKEVPMIANELPTGNYFIGLIDADGTDEFAWMNGDEFVQANFGQNFENLTGEPAVVILNEDGEWEVVSMANATANFVFEKVCVTLEMEIIESADDIDPEIAESGSTAQIQYLAVDPCGNTAACGFEVVLVEETVAYCEPTGIATDEDNPFFIESLSLNDYTVQSGDDNGYGNHTNENFLFEPGEVLSMEAIFAGPNIDEVPMYVRVWMDLNNDGDFFDEGELTMQGVDVSEIIGQLTIPNINHSVENTVMRIAISRLTYAESCGDFLNGEVEDYTISIIQPENSQAPGGNGLNTIATTQVDADMLIYPNPAQDEMFVKLSNMEAETATMRIFNSVGQMIASEKVATTAAIRMDVSDYTNGLYSITVEADGEVFLTQKFVVEK